MERFAENPCSRLSPFDRGAFRLPYDWRPPSKVLAPPEEVFNEGISLETRSGLSPKENPFTSGNAAWVRRNGRFQALKPSRFDQMPRSFRSTTPKTILLLSQGDLSNLFVGILGLDADHDLVCWTCKGRSWGSKEYPENQDHKLHSLVPGSGSHPRISQISRVRSSRLRAGFKECGSGSYIF